MKKITQITEKDLENFLIHYHSFSEEYWTPPKLIKFEIDKNEKEEDTIYLTFTQTNFVDNKDMEISGSLKFGGEPLTCLSWVSLQGNKRDSIDIFNLSKLKFWHNLGYNILQLES